MGRRQRPPPTIKEMMAASKPQGPLEALRRHQPAGAELEVGEICDSILHRLNQLKETPDKTEAPNWIKKPGK